MNKSLVLLYLLSIPTIQLMTAQSIAGEYRLTGIHDMAAGFKFTPDGRFEFFYIYGVSDRNATGTYAIEGDTIKLKSDKVPGNDFHIDAQSKKGKGFTIQVKAPNDFLLSNVLCMYYVGEVQESAMSDSKGVIHLDIPSCDKIYLRHEIFPDIPTLIKDKDNSNNSFEVSLLPTLGQVSFKGIDLFIKEDTLSCLPNYFMPFEQIAFVKD